MFLFLLGPSGVKVMTRKRVYDIMKDQPDCDINKKIDFAESFLLNTQNYSEGQRKQVKHKLFQI